MRSSNVLTTEWLGAVLMYRKQVEISSREVLSGVPGSVLMY